MIKQSKFRTCVSQQAIGNWALAILVGSVVAACSGTIETPTEEYPARQGNVTAPADNDDDDTPAAPTTPRAPAAPVAEDPDDEPTAPPADDEEEAEEPPAEAPAPAAGALSFETDIWPIFQAQCGPCHVSVGLGGQNIGADDLDAALADAIRVEEAVIAELEEGEMPPGCGSAPGGGAGCVSADDFAAIEDWYAAGAPE